MTQNADASRERSQARDTKYRRSGRVARIPRSTYFLFPLPRVDVFAQGGFPAMRHGAVPRILLRRDRRRRAWKPIRRPVRRKSCGVVDLTDGTRRRRRHAERAHKERKKREKRKKQKKKKCGRFYFLKHDERRYPQARDNTARLPALTTAKFDESTPLFRVWWWITKREGCAYIKGKWCVVPSISNLENLESNFGL